LVAQAATKTHLSQSSGAGAFDGQHGMSLAIKSSAIMSLPIASAEAAIDISSAMAGIDASEAMPAMTGRDNGAKTSPAITEIASRRRMVIWRFTRIKFHRTVQIDSLPRLTTP
jgi:hypothetical protein